MTINVIYTNYRARGRPDIEADIDVPYDVEESGTPDIPQRSTCQCVHCLPSEWSIIGRHEFFGDSKTQAPALSCFLSCQGQVLWLRHSVSVRFKPPKKKRM